MFIGKYNKSVIITYIGVIFGILGVYFTICSNISSAIICLILAGICDMFDGKVARMCKRDDSEKEFGIQLDSLADVFLFVAFPAVMGVKFFSQMPILNIVLIVYMLAGIIRLAWFNMIADIDGPVKYYTGLPVTSIAIILPIFYAISLVLKFEFTYLAALIYLLVGIFFILNVKIPKTKGIWYVIFSLLAVIFTTIIIIWG